MSAKQVAFFIGPFLVNCLQWSEVIKTKPRDVFGYKSTRAFPDLRRHLSTLCGSIAGTWCPAREAAETDERSPTCKEITQRVLHGRKHPSCCLTNPLVTEGKIFSQA